MSKIWAALRRGFLEKSVAESGSTGMSPVLLLHKSLHLYGEKRCSESVKQLFRKDLRRLEREGRIQRDDEGRLYGPSCAVVRIKDMETIIEDVLIEAGIDARSYSLTAVSRLAGFMQTQGDRPNLAEARKIVKHAVGLSTLRMPLASADRFRLNDKDIGMALERLGACR